MNSLEFGQLVAEQREACGLSQAQLARAAGISRVTVSLLENGQLQEVGLAMVLAMLDVLGLDLRLNEKSARKHGLEIAAATASTSYREALPQSTLQKILVTGLIPDRVQAHMMTLLAEAPLEVVIGPVAQSAGNANEAKAIINNLRNMGRTWKIHRLRFLSRAVMLNDQGSICRYLAQNGK